MTHCRCLLAHPLSVVAAAYLVLPGRSAEPSVSTGFVRQMYSLPRWPGCLLAVALCRPGARRPQTTPAKQAIGQKLESNIVRRRPGPAEESPGATALGSLLRGRAQQKVRSARAQGWQTAEEEGFCTQEGRVRGSQEKIRNARPAEARARAGLIRVTQK